MIILFLIIILLILIYLNFDKIKTLFFKNKNFIFKILFSFLIFSGLFFLVSFLIKFFPNLKLDDKFLKIFADNNENINDNNNNKNQNFTPFEKSNLNQKQNFIEIVEKKDLSQIEKEQENLKKIFDVNILEEKEFIENELNDLKKFNLSTFEVEKILEDNFVTKEDLEIQSLSSVLNQICNLNITYEIALKKDEEQCKYIQENELFLENNLPKKIYKEYSQIINEKKQYFFLDILPYETSQGDLVDELLRKRQMLILQDIYIKAFDSNNKKKKK